MAKNIPEEINNSVHFSNLWQTSDLAPVKEYCTCKTLSAGVTFYHVSDISHMIRNTSTRCYFL